MRTTFVLVLPDRRGELLKVEHILSGQDLYVSRVSFNKVVDVHTCFVEVEGPDARVAAAERELREQGYLSDQARLGRVRLVEFDLPDVTGSLLPLLDLIRDSGLSITYLNVRGSGEEAGAPREGSLVRVGLYVEDEAVLGRFVERANAICPAHVLAYEHSLEVVDNNLFYVSYARTIAKRFHLDAEQERVILVNMNRIVQNLERTTHDPFKPFDYLGQFAEAIDTHRADAWREAARVSRFETRDGIKVLSVEPPAGCTSWIFDLPDGIGDGKDDGRAAYFVIDTGYGCYEEEYRDLLRAELPDWEERRHVLFLTHADVDHSGACGVFDDVRAVDDVIDNFRLEHQGLPGWRERTPLFLPYVRITNILTAYESPDVATFASLGRRPDGADEPIARCVDQQGRPATFNVGPLSFEVWQGAGGHVRGETVLIDRAERLCVSGDIFINIHGETKVQHRFNMLSPYLMTSVDSVPDLERKERRYLFQLLDAGQWQILGGHGPVFQKAPKNPK